MCGSRAVGRGGPCGHAERPERTDDARARARAVGDPWRAELRAIRHEARELAHSLRHAVRAYTPDARQLTEIRVVIGEARRRIEAILAARRAGPRSEEGGTPTVL